MAVRARQVRLLMLLAADRAVDNRKSVAARSLAPVADSLAADLERLLPDEDVFIPAEKARMTRRGGRCPRDGAFLEFDPRSPSKHRCPGCGSQYEGDDHYRWWIMGYQLWLAERAVHASVLWRLRGAARHRQLAEAILGKLADAYLRYPNEDNVLGPTRVFFSTYLESIWSLQLSLAVSLLERDGAGAMGARVRERILAPSTELIASFNEGLSNRQVWNSAALGAAGALLGQPAQVDRALTGQGGLEDFLRSGLLEDGSWYEGENYHLFAHRGLWHLVMMADQCGGTPDARLLARFELGFVAPLRTALPDFTFPARRDSQYRASLRQWRIAESLELGAARAPDSLELRSGLGVLYGSGADGDAARWRSTAEAERNVPGVRLTRADLGWKSLLFALPDVNVDAPASPKSALMSGQGLGVIRRDQGRTYVGLDYGHTGGSHGHPDRLNLWLQLGEQRVFEDVGTGSYVERTLHWYRSTLAHNAPLIDGRSQDAVAGSLRAWDERGDYSWIDAQAGIASGVVVRRSVIAGPGHVIDRVEWSADREVTFDLPMHVDGSVEGAVWRAAALAGASGLEDGFAFVSDSETTEGKVEPVTVSAPRIDGTVHVNVEHAWWRAAAPGPPGEGPRRFLLIRARGSSGCITSAWSWTGPVEMRGPQGDVLEVSVAGAKFNHRVASDTWHVTHEAMSVMLDGHKEATRSPTAVDATASVREVLVIPMLTPDIAVSGDLSQAKRRARKFELGKSNYRRTEATWEEAGSPTATVVIGATHRELLIEVSVNTPEPNFVEARDENPLDNEHPDVNSDGIQIHLAAPDRSLAASWLLVPEPSSDTVRTSARGDAASIPLIASWRRTGAGWQLLARIDRPSLGVRSAQFGLDVIVNEMPRGRERRRGQLVLSGRGTEWAWLRGDRQDVDRLIPMAVRSG